MKLMLIGANGQLGWELSKRSVAAGFDVMPLDLPHFDITNRSQVENRLLRQSDVSLVINASAYTAVDRAESDLELAFAVNSDGPANLASACAEAGIPLIHVSTDYVFDGNKMSPYCETDPVCPLGVYGKSKMAGENEVRVRLREHIILRTAWLYGVEGNNFVKTMLCLGCEKERIRVVADQFGSPTYAADLADAILKIAARIDSVGPVSWGTFHYTGKGETSWHGFAEKIFEYARQHIKMKIKEVEAITTADYPTPAKRPVNSVLDCSLLETRFEISARPWQEGLAEMIDCLFKSENENHHL